MDEVAIITSSKDASGILVVDCKTGNSTATNFKNCIAEPGICKVLLELDYYFDIELSIHIP